PLSLCSPQGNTFTADPGTGRNPAANPYFPLTSALEGTLVGTDADGTTHGLHNSLAGYEFFYGRSIKTRVVEEFEWHDDNANGVRDSGELAIEDAFNYFAQAANGSVCYFGEFVNNYDEKGILIPDDHHGSWRADLFPPTPPFPPLPADCTDPGPNAPGINMPANPKTGMHYQQESAPCVAHDVAQI